MDLEHISVSTLVLKALLYHHQFPPKKKISARPRAGPGREATRVSLSSGRPGMTGERRYGHNIPITTAERSERAGRVQAEEGNESWDRLGPVSLDSTDQDEHEHRRGSEGQVTHRKQLGLCPTDTGQSEHSERCGWRGELGEGSRVREKSSLALGPTSQRALGPTAGNAFYY